jgi:hypothetical protein
MFREEVPGDVPLQIYVIFEILSPHKCKGAECIVVLQGVLCFLVVLVI